MKKIIETFNPTVKSFLEKHHGKTMLGFYWALVWRFGIAVYATFFLLAIIIGFFRLILGLHYY